MRTGGWVVVAVIGSLVIAAVAVAQQLPDALGALGAPSRPVAGGRQVGDGGLLSWSNVALWLAAWAAVGGLGLAGVGVALVRRRLRNRLTREYGLYEVHLSMHDEAKAQDLEDMVEAIGSVVRAFPERRARDGQPFLALECHYGPGPAGMEWAICLRCEIGAVEAIEAALQSAYPDVRVGRAHDERPQPIGATLRTPGHVLRFRKARSLIYPLSGDGDTLASPPLEAIAQQQVAVGCMSSVRVQLIPAMDWVEAWARGKFERREDRLLRSRRWGLAEAGTRSVLHAEELRDARRTQNRGLLFLDLQVAADTRENANRIAAAVTARRGDNHLRRRWMIARQGLYRRRFASAYPPLMPSVGWGNWPSIVSTTEVAHLLELPTARLKGVPVRRVALPRLPAPPEAARATDGEEVALPPSAGAALVDAAPHAPDR